MSLPKDTPAVPPDQDQIQRDERVHEGQQELLRSLEPAGVALMNHYEGISNPYPDTCLWVYGNPEYQVWSKGERGILLIKGQPGSGKSTLLKAIINAPTASTVSNDQSSLNLRHFFHHEGHETSGNRFRGFVQSVFLQVLERRRDILQQFLPTHSSPETRLLRHVWSEEELESGLKTVFTQLLSESTPIILFIDAFEDCQGKDLTRILKFFESLGALPGSCPFRICISSRYYPVAAESAFKNLSLWNTRIIMMEDWNLPDISHFVLSSLKGLEKSVQEDLGLDQPESEILSRIVASAGNCFLIAVIFLKTILQGMKSSEDIQNLLKTPPTEVQRLWEKSLRDLDVKEQDRALSMFQFVLVAYRPLSPLELEAVVLGPLIPDFTIEERVISYSAGLLRIRQASKNLSNESYTGARSPRASISGATNIQTFVDFVNPMINTFLEAFFKNSQPMVLRSHKRVVQRSVSYLEDNRSRLSMSHFRIPDAFPLMHQEPPEEDFQKLYAAQPFLGYAVKFLFQHSKILDTEGVSLADVFPTLCSKDSPVLKLWEYLYDDLKWATSRYESESSLSNVAAGFDLKNYISSSFEKSASKKKAEFECESDSGSKLLHWAALNGSLAVVRYLLDEALLYQYQAASKSLITPTPTTIQHGEDRGAAALRKWSGISRYLRSPFHLGYTALHLAAGRGHEDVVADLLRCNKECMRQLQNACKAMGEDVERQLNTESRLLQQTDSQGDTALHLAAFYGHDDIVQALLNAGADFKITNNNQETPKERSEKQLKLAISTNDENQRELKARHRSVLGILLAAEHADLGLASRHPHEIDFRFTANVVHFFSDSGLERGKPAKGDWSAPFGHEENDLSFKRKLAPVYEVLEGRPIFEYGFGDEAYPSFKWVHLPANNMRWVELLMLQLDRRRENGKFRNAVLKPDLWTERQQRGSKRSQISFMRPTCQAVHVDSRKMESERSRSDSSSSEPRRSRYTRRESRSGSEKHDKSKDPTVLFMPFIHWETRSRQLELENVMFLNYLELQKGHHPSIAQQKLEDLSVEGAGYIRRMLDAYNKKLPSNLLGKLPQKCEELIKVLKVLRQEENWADSATGNILSDLYSLVSDQDNDKRLIKIYSGSSHPLHIRRTLDQSYYYTLDDTRSRDGDQVVTRYSERLKSFVPVVMMVDQLWLWILDDTIITCFPQRQADAKAANDPDPYDSTDVLESIMRSLGQVRNSDDLVALIVSECSGACFEANKLRPANLQFVEMFENSINKIADEEAGRYQYFIDIVAAAEDLKESDILKESKLLREIKDIIDELTIIGKIFEEQDEVIEKACGLWGRKRRNSMEEARHRVRQYPRKVSALKDHCWAIYESLKVLIDLQQKHANLSEARSARTQADATGKQGNTIMVFTIVTILFLPASFMASFFALAIGSFKHDQNGDLQLGYVIQYMMIFTVITVLIFGTLAFKINEIAAFFKRKKPAKKGPKLEGDDILSSLESEKDDRMGRRRKSESSSSSDDTDAGRNPFARRFRRRWIGSDTESVV